MELFMSVFAACVIVFPIYLISTAITTSRKRQDTAVQKAIAQGHVVNAVLIKRRNSRRRIPGTLNFDSSVGYYEYKYKGKTYKYKFWADNPPSTLKLYFIRNPRKATVDRALNTSNTCWPMVYLIVSVLFYLIMSS